MNVRELIEQLQKLPQDARVVKHNCEGDYEDAYDACVVNVIIDAYRNSHYAVDQYLHADQAFKNHKREDVVVVS